MDGAPRARILLRSMLDNLNAQILYMEAQSSDKEYISNLEKIRSVVIKLQEAEISGIVLDEEEAMSGLTTKTDFKPDIHSNYEGLELCGLNLLRTLIREIEISALMVSGVHDSLEICYILNQLGSAVRALMSKYI